MGGPAVARPASAAARPPVKYHYSDRFFTYPVRRGGEPPARGSRFWRQAPGARRARPAPGTASGGEFDWGGTPVKA